MAHDQYIDRVNLILAVSGTSPGGPGAIRTRDTRFRRAVLYPLSYEPCESKGTGGPINYPVRSSCDKRATSAG
jgi:hypothetical protein